MTLILASASPRRAELLKSTGLDFEIRVSEIDESPLPNEGAEALVLRLSAEKAKAVRVLYPDAKILAADTIVVLEDQILGKPKDAGEAEAMLRSLSGRAHEVMTGFTLVRPGYDSHSQRVLTQVTFRELSSAEIRSYVQSGEPMDKAGAYGIQCGAAGFVSGMEGSYTNVVGLPLAEVLVALSD